MKRRTTPQLRRQIGKVLLNGGNKLLEEKRGCLSSASAVGDFNWQMGWNWARERIFITHGSKRPLIFTEEMRVNLFLHSWFLRSLWLQWIPIVPYDQECSKNQFYMYLSKFLCPIFEKSTTQVFKRVLEKSMMKRSNLGFYHIFGILDTFYEQWYPF